MPMRRVHISDEDLEIAEQALRRLANRYKNDARKIANPVVRDGFLENARECEAIAERMKRFRVSDR